jgi:uncharacterized protein (DUF427 family)
MATATVNGTVIAEAADDEIIHIEGNSYFSPTPYTCPWKGECQYFVVTVDGQALPDRAWSYPQPYESGIERVGKDFSNYVAFWKEVQVS